MKNLLFSVKVGEGRLFVEKGDIIVLAGEANSGRTETLFDIMVKALKDSLDVCYVSDELNHTDVKTRLHSAFNSAPINIEPTAFTLLNSLSQDDLTALTEEYKTKEQDLVLVLDVRSNVPLANLEKLLDFADEVGAAIFMSIQTKSGFSINDEIKTSAKGLSRLQVISLEKAKGKVEAKLLV